MKKLGTLTFHWATNYGAVLQAYALQQFFLLNGYDSEIIDYIPLQNIIIQRLSWVKNRNFNMFRREKVIKKFRKNNLKITKRKYFSNKALFSIKNDFDVIVSGSDQVMNLSFIKYAEYKKQTLSYYQNFVGTNTKKITYAASFGTDSIPNEFKKVITEELKSFSWVSVRENSAQKMLLDLGINSDVVVDPTILLHASDYKNLTNNKNITNRFCSFILHQNQYEATKIEKYLSEVIEKPLINGDSKSVQEWLDNIRYTDFLLTNSFHATVFAILFHIPFLVVAVEGSNMNGRIKTLLNMTGLENRFVLSFDKEEIDKIKSTSPDWISVDDRMESYRTSSQKLLINTIEG